MKRLDDLISFSTSIERMHIEHPQWVLRVIIFDVVLFVITFTAWLVWPLFVGKPFGVVLAVLVGLQLGRTCLLGVRRAATYRSGWLRGREAFVSSMQEAMQRGFTLEQWLSREFARDVAIMGEVLDDDELTRIVEAQRQQRDEP